MSDRAEGMLAYNAGSRQPINVPRPIPSVIALPAQGSAVRGDWGEGRVQELRAADRLFVRGTDTEAGIPTFHEVARIPDPDVIYYTRPCAECDEVKDAYFGEPNGSLRCFDCYRRANGGQHLNR